jgi:hypothetical protein
MNPIHGETLSRLVDGDVVDPDVLSEALDTTDGRRLLVDFARARAAIATGVQPSSAWRARVEQQLAASTRHAVTARSPRSLSLRAAAALAAVALGLGAAAAHWRDTRPARPPEAARVLQFERVADAGGGM